MGCVARSTGGSSLAFADRSSQLHALRFYSPMNAAVAASPASPPRATASFNTQRVTTEAFPWSVWLSAAAVPLMAIVLRLSSSPTANASYVLLALYAFAGPRQAIVSLAMCWAFNVLNHGLAPMASLAAFLRYGIIAAAFLSAIVHLRPEGLKKTGWLLPVSGVFCLFLIVHSIAVSGQPDVSTLKAISFMMTVAALCLTWCSLQPRDRQLTESLLFAGLVLIMAASLPLIFSSIGYFRNGRGFQGIQVHPQGFGPTMAVLASIVVGQLLVSRKIRLWQIVVLAVSVACVYLSQARVGALAFVAGTAVAVTGEIVRSMLTARRMRQPLQWGRLSFFGIVGLVACIIASPWLTAAVTQFISKGSKNETIVEAAVASRGWKVTEMLETFRENPMTGTGFGVLASADYWQLARDPIFGLPVMATVEKGVLPVAILEETGLPGALIAYTWLFVLAANALRGGLVPNCALWAVLATNVAEANLLAPGGQGMFQLIVAIWAATAIPPMATAAQANPAPSRIAA